MAEWFERAFGATVDEAQTGIADARAKLIDEAWFGRRAPEPQRQGNFGSTREDQPAPTEPSDPAQERDHGIDR